MTNQCDISSKLNSHCSLHSCNSSDYCHQMSSEMPYTSSLSSDTLWEPKSDQVKQRPNSVYHQPASQQYATRYVHPSQVQPIQNAITTTHAYMQPQYTSKPKSWDNLAAKGCGNYAFGYVVNNPPKQQPTPSARNHQTQQNHAPPPLPRKSAPYGRYSSYVENIIPAPQAYIEEATITKTTIITTKSTENLINNAQYNLSDGSCECIVQPSPKLTKPIASSNCAACNAGAYQGYYSNIARNNSNRCIVPTKTEITRL